MALQFHPDKNHAPKADEAFKVVSRSFSCLSDPNKKAQYDQFGVAADTAGGVSHGSGGGMRFRGAQSFFYESEISPEELFSTFFGDMMQTQGRASAFHFATNAAAFGPMFSRQRRREKFYQQQAQQPTGLMALITQFIPIIVMALVILLSNVFFSPSEPWSSISRHVSLQQSKSYPHQFATKNLKVPYYGSGDFEHYFHKKRLKGSRMKELKTYEEAIERKYVGELQENCCKEQRNLQIQRSKAAENPSLLEELKNEKCPSCEKLHELGISK